MEAHFTHLIVEYNFGKTLVRMFYMTSSTISYRCNQMDYFANVIFLIETSIQQFIYKGTSGAAGGWMEFL